MITCIVCLTELRDPAIKTCGSLKCAKRYKTHSKKYWVTRYIINLAVWSTIGLALFLGFLMVIALFVDFVLILLPWIIFPVIVYGFYVFVKMVRSL